ncbi:ATP-binding cassette domain-containing protein [Actinomadura sp. KC216]|uniref:ATP-binding cassette domain-containing protein n=1 Tax=Actinomadura sp. KC216 TaxID=2530370 RepID=UPI001A9D397D|nr:ATP-binding cassette domain-containing protein [Actinomadura sp. KC216]
MSAIEVEALRKVYEDGTVALDGPSFQVAPGEIFGYLGRNGAGKTTTVRILTTLARPSSGTATVLGHDVVRERAQVREVVGLSLQQAALDDLMTGREHLALIASLRAMRSAAARDRIDELLTGFGLTDIADRLVATYTVGMRRRLDAAMALIHRPSVLFLDEPTTGLDPQSRRALWKLIREYRDDGGTVFLTTQYLDEADELCDRIAILGNGNLLVVDTPAALKNGLSGKVLRLWDASAEARTAMAELLGEAACQSDGTLLRIDLSGQEDRLPEILGNLRDLGIGLESVALADPTIEEVFMRLTGESVESDGGLDRQATGVAAIGRTIVNSRGGGS